MNNKDAAMLLNITGELTTAIIKRAYKVACSKYHPDKGGSTFMMQSVNEAYSVLKDFEGTVSSGDLSYPAELNEAINAVINLEGVEIEICGAWVWVTGNTKPYSKILGKKEGGAGFYWANKKKAWYFRPADWKSASRGKWSMDKIREAHGSSSVQTKSSAKIAA
tara:strand:+ start:1155 stop:1646 length:492 start_codon:yes stop_codon:yes gene_type:complete